LASPSLRRPCAVATAVAACEGDLRDTIRTLVIANGFLMEEVERYKSVVSAGFIRRLSMFDAQASVTGQQRYGP
jgi:hypothetical protein